MVMMRVMRVLLEFEAKIEILGYSKESELLCLVDLLRHSS